MIVYEGLERLLKENGIKRSELAAKLGISSRTIAKIGKNEKLSDAVLKKLSTYFPVRLTNSTAKYPTILCFKS